MASSRKGVRQLLGTLLPPKEPLDELEVDCLKEDVEEDEDPVFIDAEELCSGGLKAGSLPERLHVVISDENTQELCHVFGRFLMTSPWWQVKINVKSVGLKKYQAQGLPSYFLQYDMSPPNQKHICSLFLKECSLPSDTISKFLDWIDAVSGYENLNFGNLRDKFRTFQKETERKGQKCSQRREEKEVLSDEETSLLESAVPFRNVMTAVLFPRIMEFLPVLLPRHFKRLIDSSSTILQAIENILATCPWKLGFAKIAFRELNLLRCEASWTAFCQCEALLQLMTDLEKNALIIYSKLKEICREQGHTYVEVDDLTTQLSEQMFYSHAWDSLKFLKDTGVVTYEKNCVFLYDLYQAERGIASSICDLMMRPPWHLRVNVKKVLASIQATQPEASGSGDTVSGSPPDEARSENSADALDTQDNDSNWNNVDNEVSAEITEAQLDQDQVTALEMICSSSVTVISGKGGCGKTTIVSRLFKHIEQLEEREVKKACEDFEQDMDAPEEWVTFTEESQLTTDKAIEVLLTAPTGKAAGLLRQKTGLHAYTLCQVNYSYYSWKEKSSTKDKPWKFSSIRVLVVDEGSLVSVGILRSVLRLLCEHSKLSKLIILGDIRQLPSIEPGNLLKDLFDTLKSRNCAIELKTNHRAESELIVDNATRISRREFPKFDAELNISDNSALPLSIQDKTFIFIRLPEEDASSQLSKSDHRSHLYSAVTTLLKEEDLKDAKTSQFIAFRKQDCDIINACCCKHYTGHLIKNAYLSDLLPGNTLSSQQNNDLEASGKDFNATPQGSTNSKHDFESGLRLCNGEIFFITNDITDVTFGRKRIVTISNMAGLEVTVDFEKLLRYCHIKHAWARTIHTFQGSEECTIVYVVGQAGRQHWQHVYTAVTRGRCRVYVIAAESQLRNAITRHSIPRKTRLKHFLQKELSMSSVVPEAPAAPSDFASLPKSSGDSRGSFSTQLPAWPPPAATAAMMLNGSPGSQAFADTQRFSSSQEVGTDVQNSPTSRGSKRTGGIDVDESPSKILMVEEPSPQVSSRLQNLRLNSLTPRQLFKSTHNQGT
ncbi:DNA helicase B isoform X2 [Erinaceus europaeus]|uniref:DNA helicase B isoform X2 n=1 Tax=Erinaceus europaeus TaxID=9365 RepID=A0ABM3XQ61_ERIEU|nr:DNA helicase B isoform X2 [Erinaceus europaeus]